MNLYIRNLELKSNLFLQISNKERSGSFYHESVRFALASLKLSLKLRKLKGHSFEYTIQFDLLKEIAQKVWIKCSPFGFFIKWY